MEENYILKSQKKKRLHFTFKLLIGLIVIALICFGFIFTNCAYNSYDQLQYDHDEDVASYTDYDGVHYSSGGKLTGEPEYRHYDGYATIENGQCIIHKQKVAKVIREAEWEWNGDFIPAIVEHKWITKTCKHELHDYKDRYDYAFKSIKNGSAPVNSNTNGEKNWLNRGYFDGCYTASIVVYLLFAIYIIIKHLKNRKYEIIVTTNEVQGRLAFGKKITIPAYNIKSVCKKGKYKVIIETEDKPIKFKYIKNSNEIVEAINNLDKSIPESLVNSGFGSEANIPNVPEELNPNVPEELKAYKDLFDSGIISEQEYLNKIKEFNEKA